MGVDVVGFSPGFLEGYFVVRRPGERSGPAKVGNWGRSGHLSENGSVGGFAPLPNARLPHLSL
ncbi:hypothetical protein GCM10011504_58100 [Siccirubricoccus deserti]|nr:hypothetical protein GCM10011504_58100 [Siccirubricoccus deserti]